MAADAECLLVRNLIRSFGGLVAVNDLSFTVHAGLIVGLIGPNGSGKTVTFDCITGFSRPDAGKVFFRDREITALGPKDIASRGIARSFQITGIFHKLTVLENLLFAGQPKQIISNITSTFRGNTLKNQLAEPIEQVLQLTGLHGTRDELAVNLPHGQQKMLEFGTLMLMNPEPSLYLLDEPFAGLTHADIARYVNVMKEMTRQGKTFLIVEHNMRVIMNVCTSIIVLDHGAKIAEGRPDEIQKNARVVEAYLGHAATAPRQ